MLKRLCSCFFLSLMLFSSCQPSVKTIELSDNAQYIDPFICTANDHGQTDVAAAVPFGMVKPCPDTYPTGHAGYDYDSNTLLGFSHTRFSGVGCRGVGGNIRVLPFVNSDTIPQNQTYIKGSEVASPGYYAVTLSQGIRVELSATHQVAYHRYVFPHSEKSGLTIDLNSSFVAPISESHQIDQDGVLSGRIESVNVCKMGKYSFYYALYVDKSQVEIEEDVARVTWHFSSDKNEEIKLWCALSTISEAYAKEKLEDAMHTPFLQVKANAYQAWNKHVNVVHVETDDVSKKRLFYTHLYHASQSPFEVSEADGAYRGSDGKVYSDQLDKYYHGWSVWDTFRSKLPLLSFLYTQEYKCMLSSLGELYKQGKPEWATDTEPFLTVRTEHTLAIVLDAYRKGILPFPLTEIYSKFKEEAAHLPYESPDNVLESSYDFWALSQIAGIIDSADDAKLYADKAMDYRLVWNDKFLTMDENSDIMHGDGLYEGTLWQYRWFVPFDIKGIQSLMGGQDVFEKDLDYFFTNELFNIGNQPDIQVPYLYAYTSSPWKTQGLVHRLLNEEVNNWYGTHKKLKKPIKRKIFLDEPEGYIKEMDDDAGTMSAWYVWSSLGFYPVFPGSMEMVLTAPQFDRYTIRLAEQELEVQTIRPSAKAIYIQSVEWNGKAYNSCFVNFNALMKGGKIKIVLGESPNKNWGQ